MSRCSKRRGGAGPNRRGAFRVPARLPDIYGPAASAVILPRTAVWISQKGVAESGGFVDSWTSYLGGISCTLAQATAGFRPAYAAAAGVGGRPLISTDGVNDHLFGTITLGAAHAANEWAITGDRVALSVLGNVVLGYYQGGALRYGLRDRTAQSFYNGVGTSTLISPAIPANDPDGNNQRWWCTRDLATTSAAIGDGANTAISTGAAVVVSYVDGQQVYWGSSPGGVGGTATRVQALDFGELLSASQRQYLRDLITYWTGITA